MNSFKRVLGNEISKKGIWKETIACSFNSHIVKFVSYLSGRLSLFLGLLRADSSSSSLDAQGDKKSWS